MRMIFLYPVMVAGTISGCMRYNLSMKPAHIIMFVLITVQLWPGLLAPAMADSDHLEARRLLQSGEVLSLETILDKIRGQYPGRVIEVELEMEHGQIIYEIEIVDNKGKVHELYVNARNGELLKDRQGE